MSGLNDVAAALLNWLGTIDGGAVMGYDVSGGGAANRFSLQAHACM